MVEVAGTTRFERATSHLAGERSIQLSYVPHRDFVYR